MSASASKPRRFVADWIEDMDEDGPGKEGRSVHQTYELAHAAAVAGSKKAGAIEWVRVREQEYDAKRGWHTVARWTGDYDAMEQSL